MATRLLNETIGVTLQPSETATFTLSHAPSEKDIEIDLVYSYNGSQTTVELGDWREAYSGTLYDWDGNRTFTLKNPSTSPRTWVKTTYLAEVDVYGFYDDKAKAEVFPANESYNLDDLFVLRCTVATNETINSKQSKSLTLQLPSYIGNLSYYIGVIDAQFYDSNNNRLSLAICGLDNTIYSASGRSIRVYNPTDANVTIDNGNSDVLLICAKRSKSKYYFLP